MRLPFPSSLRGRFVLLMNLFVCALAAPLREMVEGGLALGLLNAENRARLLVNLPAARNEGADLDSVFLGIVEVVGRPLPAR